jgi:hypothetical protein
LEDDEEYPQVAAPQPPDDLIHLLNPRLNNVCFLIKAHNSAATSSRSSRTRVHTLVFNTLSKFSLAQCALQVRIILLLGSIACGV